MADILGRSESKILPAEKLTPVLEGARYDGPAWEETIVSRSSAGRVGAERERDDQDRVSDVSAIGPLTLRSISNSKPDLSALDDETEQAPANTNEAGSLTKESMPAGKRGGISETHSMEQSARDGLRSPTAEGGDAMGVPSRRSSVDQNIATSDAVDVPQRGNPVDQNSATSLADSSCFLSGVPRQQGDDDERPGLSTECRRSDSPEVVTSALLLAQRQARGTHGGAEHVKSCTIQLNDSQQEGGTKPTPLANTLSATEQASQGENTGDFHALLREAMQQSDAELEAEKQSACNFKRQLSLPALAERSPPHQRGSPRQTLQSVTTTSNIAEGCYRKDCGSGGTDCVSNAVEMDGSSSSSALAAPLSETTQGQWVRYVSPEGHPYLYNEVTGDSRWADPSEEELLQVHTAADTRRGDTRRGAVNNAAETKRAGANHEDGGPDGTGSFVVDGEGREQVAEEGGSACMFEASQTSQDTSDPDARNSAGETAMHLAAAQHSVRGLRLLLTGGANVNATDERGRTPLHVACENRQRSPNDPGSDQSRECIELLLSRGALEDARDAKGLTPLHVSALAGNLGAAQALLMSGATASADAAGNSPLHLAAAQGHSEIIQLLVLGNRACDTHNSASSVASEEVPSPKLAHDEGSGSSAATELAGEETDASGSVSEARYPSSDRPPLVDGRHPLDHAVANSSSGDGPYNGAAFQTSDADIYQGNVTGVSRRPQQRGLLGAERRAQNETRTDVEDLPTSFGADAPMHRKRPGKLCNSHHVGGPEAAAGVALDDGSSSCGVVATSCRGSGYLARSTETIRGETEAVEYRRDSHERRRELGTPHEARETRHAPTASVSARAKESRCSWNGLYRSQSPPLRRRDQLGREFDHAEVVQTGLDKFGTREWPPQNVGNSNRTREEGDEDGGRKNRLDHEYMRQRPDGKERKASRRSRRRQGSNRDDQAAPWPEALSPARYDQAVGTVLATRGEDSGAPPYSALAEALFAACVASRLEDAAAVLGLLELHGGDTSDIVYEGGRTPLHYACRGDDVSLVRLLCRARADPEARDFQGNSPLMVAAATGSTSCLRFLLQGGVNPHGCNELGDTPLHVAAWHGNLSCVKALIGGGARLSQRNRSGLTAREGLLNAGPSFSGGRRPKALRAILEYLEWAEASVTQSKHPTWASQDEYDSDFTAVTAASRTSPERRIDMDISGSKANIPRRQAVHDSHVAKGDLSGCSRGSRTPAAPGDREREGERNWEGWKAQEERGVREGRREGDAVFSRTQRRNSKAEECLARNVNFGQTEESQLHHPYGGGCATNSALNSDGSRAPHFEPSRERYNPSYSVAEGDFSAKQVATQSDYGVGEYDARRRYERDTARRKTLDDNSDSHGPRHRRAEQGAAPNASVPSREGGGVWSAVGRAFDYIIGGSDGRDGRDGSGSNTESDDCALNKPPNDHPTWRPPTDSELRDGTVGMKSSSSKPMPREIPGVGSAGATCADTLGGSQQVDAPLATESHDTKVPLSLTPMQPPPDVLAAMKGRMAAGQRQQFSAPPADVAAAIDNAAERRQRDYVVHRRGVHAGAENTAGSAPGIAKGAR